MKRVIFLLLTVFNTMLMIFFALLAVCGSLELFPTPEQIEKGTIGYFSVFLLLLVFEVFLLRKLAKLYLN